VAEITTDAEIHDVQLQTNTFPFGPQRRVIVHFSIRGTLLLACSTHKYDLALFQFRIMCKANGVFTHAFLMARFSHDC